jgi:hypothetical protein
MVVQEKKPQAARKSTLCLLLCMLLAGVPTASFGMTGHAEQGSPSGAACEVDDECQSRFCDTGVCRLPEGQYGAICTPAPLTTEGWRDGKLNTCGAYVCEAGRCRSCKSDSQCQQEYGAPKCRHHPTRPGQRCGA